MTVIINLYGGPGTGKSTTAAQLFAVMKHEKFNVELVREYAKELVWADKKIECQLEILTEQYRRVRELNGKVDYIITDSPILLSLYYGGHMSDTFKDLVKELNDQFYNVDIFLERVKEYKVEGRLQTEEEAKTIDLWIKENLKPTHYIKADKQAAANLLELIKTTCNERI